MDKAIITCAITGSIHTPSMTPHLPITPDQIAAEAIAAAEAGAAMLHLHARDPETGKPDQKPDLFKQFLPRVKQATDAIINITTGGGLGMTLDQRLAAAKYAQPEIASMNMGSFNFNISGAAAKVTSWK
ncbi:MAG: 3-keto-5-aminohexanoate cleavage protein, partial [Oxalobacteraceae bacterium]